VEFNSNGLEKNKPGNRKTALLLGIYLLILIWVLLFKLGVRFSYMNKRSFNLDPFTNYFELKEVISNVIVFVPLGVYVGTLFAKEGFTRKFLLIFLTSFIIEASQFILAVGAFDVLDLMANTFGGIVGLVFFNILALKNKQKAQKFVNTIAIIGTFLVVAFLVLLKLDLLPIRYR
jgi:glycopeptide antibiotics resistance protein